jgi:hypothetical protein
MHFHLGGRDLLEDLTTWAIIQEMVSTEVLSSREREEAAAKKTGPSKMPNWTIQFHRRVHKLLDSGTSSGYESQGLVQGLLEMFRTGKCRGMSLWPMIKRTKCGERSRAGFSGARQSPGQENRKWS